MLSTEYEKKKELFLRYYEALQQQLKWKVDKRTLMLMASQLTTADRQLDVHQLVELAEEIKRRSGFFSNLRSSLRYTIALSLLTNHDDDPLKMFDKLIASYQDLLEAGFSRSIFTYFAAASVLSNWTNGTDVKKQARRAKTIYDEMRRKHFFVTSYDDYPLAVMLAQSDRDVDAIMDEIAYYYKKLSSHVFRKGNNLQLLSHILTCGGINNRELLVNRTMQWHDALRSQDIKIRGLHYAALGILALIESPDHLISDVTAMYDALNASKQFKWYKEMNLVVAIPLIVQEKLHDPAIAATGLTTAIEVILQAQRTAMIVATGSAVAAANTSSSSSS